MVNKLYFNKAVILKNRWLALQREKKCLTSASDTNSLFDLV